MLWVALISICLVFLVLVLLVWVMKLFGYVFTRRQAAATCLLYTSPSPRD